MVRQWVGVAPWAAVGGWGLVVLLSGCATIMHGTTQDVRIASTPSGIPVLIDHTPAGVTPMVATLSRKTDHLVRIELEGFQTVEIDLTRAVSRWAWGDIVLGGPIGLGIDALTGGLYNLQPDEIHAILEHGEGMFIARGPAWSPAGARR